MTPAQLEAVRTAHQARAATQYEQLKELLRLVLIAVLVALGLRSFVYEPFNIPSESMLPGLRVGDYLFVAKWPYGIGRYSLPFGVPVPGSRIGGGAPQRGAVVVFKSPGDNRSDFIKRVIGLPGDKVRMTGGRVEINGRLVPKQQIADAIIAPGTNGCDHARACRLPQFIEELGGRRYAVLDQLAGEVLDDTPLTLVPPGHYFVLGDNRDDSADSRVGIAAGGVGLVPAANLIGRADRIFFSVDGSARIGSPVSWWRAVRFNRIGKAL